MRKALVLCGFLLLSFSPLAQADELEILEVTDTTMFYCTAGQQDIWIQNPVKRDIKIKASEVWMGMSEKGVADFWAWVYTYDQATNVLKPLQVVGWDHYAEPTAPNNYRKTFAPDWRTLKAGQWLRLLAGCSGYPGIRAQVAVFIEYTLAP